MMKNILIVVLMIASSMVHALKITDFEKGKGGVLSKGKKSGGEFTYATAPVPRGKSAKITWEKRKPHPYLTVLFGYPQIKETKTELDGELSMWFYPGKGKEQIFSINARMMDADGEVFQWKKRVNLKSKTGWQKLTWIVKPDSFIDCYGGGKKANKKIDLPVSFYSVVVVFKSLLAGPGCIYFDDISYNTNKSSVKVLDGRNTLTFSNGKTSIALAQDGSNLKYLKVAGVKNHFKGDSSSSLWRLYLFDEKTKRLNTYPLYGSWQHKWEMGIASISSRDAKLVRKHWSDAKKLLMLEYSHPQAKVTMFFKLNSHSIVWWGEFSNKDKLPIYQFTIMDKWQLTYNQQNSFIMPGLSTSGIEYKTIKWTVYDTVNAWDGFLCPSPKNLFSLYAVQAENGPLLGTYTTLRGDGAPTGTVAVTSSTLCFRKREESLNSVKLKISSFKDLRSWADSYVHDNFPSIKKLNEKIPDAIRSKLKEAYLMPVLAGNMKKITKVIAKIPGTVILHTPAFKRPPPKGGPWDAFPNYFPPNPKYGSMDDYQKLIAEARANGHIFMPRTSFFYWVNGSDPDKKYGLKSLAKIRIDGKPRTARWALPGYIVSPSSKIVLDLLHGYFETWRKLGAEVYFTNVIGAISPHGNRYDFHPDAPAPDYYYEQIRKMMKWHGAQMPLLSEGAGAWQLPFQAGFCIHPGIQLIPKLIFLNIHPVASMSAFVMKSELCWDMNM
jgi:hypothetical protein